MTERESFLSIMRLFSLVKPCPTASTRLKMTVCLLAPSSRKPGQASSRRMASRCAHLLLLQRLSLGVSWSRAEKRRQPQVVVITLLRYVFQSLRIQSMSTNTTMQLKKEFFVVKTL